MVSETATSPRPRAILATAAIPPEFREDRNQYLRLDLNEDLSGPLARLPMPSNEALATYPTTYALARALATHVQVPVDWIRVIAGADEGIYGLFRAFLDPGDAVLLPWPTFVEFPQAAGGVGATIVKAPYAADLAFPLPAFKHELGQGPRVAVLVTPANPTGDMVEPAIVLALAASAPETLLIVDEAYAEYGGRSILDLGLPPSNIVVLRTFSKVYGLAAARVGYAVAHPAILTALRQVLPSFSLAGPSLALAGAALGCRPAVERRVLANQEGQRRIAAWGRAHGMTVHTTAANFVLLRLPTDEQALALAAALERHGVLVSDRTPILPGTLRATVGAPRHVSAFLRAMDGALRDG